MSLLTAHKPSRMYFGPDVTKKEASQRLDIGALTIRIGCWGPLYDK